MNIKDLRKKQHDLLIKPVRKDATTKYFPPPRLDEKNMSLGAAFVKFSIHRDKEKECKKEEIKTHETRPNNLPNIKTAERE